MNIYHEISQNKESRSLILWLTEVTFLCHSKIKWFFADFDKYIRSWKVSSKFSFCRKN